MPKRTTLFQDLIELIERQLTPTDAKVTGSKLMSDSLTGIQREVDIVIETISGIHPFTIGIEVIDHSRPADAPWVEGIAKKHESLPINKTIVVSRSGFYKPALKKAEAYKMEAYSFEEATNIVWKQKFGKVPEILIESFLVPYLTEGVLIFRFQSSIEKFSIARIANLEIFKPDGNSRGKLFDIVNNIIKNPKFIEKADELAFTDAGTIIEGQYPLPDGNFVVDESGEKHLVDMIRFKAKCKKELVNTEKLEGSYGGVAVSMATGDMYNHTAQFVLTTDDGENASMIMKIKKNSN